MYHTILAASTARITLLRPCPLKDKAMRIDENNIVYVVQEECIVAAHVKGPASSSPPG
jgi:hypothetical protein